MRVLIVALLAAISYAQTGPCSCPDGTGWSTGSGNCEIGSTTSCTECATQSHCTEGSCSLACEYVPDRTCQCDDLCIHPDYNNCCDNWQETCVIGTSTGDHSGCYAITYEDAYMNIIYDVPCNHDTSMCCSLRQATQYCDSTSACKGITSVEHNGQSCFDMRGGNQINHHVGSRSWLKSDCTPMSTDCEWIAGKYHFVWRGEEDTTEIFQWGCSGHTTDRWGFRIDGTDVVITGRNVHGTFYNEGLGHIDFPRSNLIYNRYTESPTVHPSVEPTSPPSACPTINPTLEPTTNPSLAPTQTPSIHPTSVPTFNPSFSPSQQPSLDPTSCPSTSPTVQPSSTPSLHPTSCPSNQPTIEPTRMPSSDPTISIPTHFPTKSPSNNPTTEYPTLAPITSIPTPHPTVDYGVVSLSFDNDYETEIGESRNPAFISECTTFIQSFGDVQCFAVYSGSIIITFYGGIEFVTNAVNSIIREGSLSIPGFNPLTLSEDNIVSTRNDILEELRQTEENARFNEFTPLTLRSDDSGTSSIDSEEIVVIFICIFGAVILIMAVCWLMEASDRKDLNELKVTEMAQKDSIPTPWLWEEEYTKRSGGAGPQVAI